MKTFYFVGGPKPGMQEKFFQRLDEIGGAPQGWTIYPHTTDDGQALHVINVEALQDILDHLAHFDDLYEYGEIVEVYPPRS
jgi:hypothetical protein